MTSSTNTETATPVISTIREIGQHEGQSVTIRGWLYNLRASGKLLFPIFRDGSGIIQGVVAKQQVAPELFDAIKGLTQESSVIVTGKVRADQRAPGGYELDVTDATVVQRVNPDDPYPITPKEHGVDFLMDHRHLWLRSPRQAAILRVRAEIIKAARDFFDDRGFTLIDPPILTPARARARPRFSRSTTSRSRPSSRSPASSTSRPRPWRWARCTASGRRSARRSRRRAAISPSSGWSSPRSRTSSSTA